MEHLTNEYGRRDQIQFSIYPSSQFSTSVVEPYNASLSTHATLEHSNCAFLFDNEVLSNIYIVEILIFYNQYIKI